MTFEVKEQEHARTSDETARSVRIPDRGLGIRSYLWFFLSGCGSQRSREKAEQTLKLDLQTMRQAIDQYTLDKQKPPQSLRDLVNGLYLKEIPTDPFTRKKDWALQIDTVAWRPEQSSAVIVDVRSASVEVGSDGKAYNEW